MTESVKKRRPRLAFSLDSEAICRIISVCANAGVSRLSMGELELQFYSPAMLAAGELSHNFDQSSPLEDDPLSAVMGTEESLKAHQGQDQASPSLDLVQKKIFDEIRLDQLALDDPLGFESQMIDAHMRPEGIR